MKKENRWHMISGDEALSLLNTDAYSGLSSKDAQSRLSHRGENSIWKIKRASVFGYALEVLSDLATALLIAAAIIAAIFGYGTEAAAICVIVVAGSVMRVAVYIKAQRMLEELAKNVIPKTRVIRDGKAMMVPSDKVVPGDIMLLTAGDTVPCDARVLSAVALEVSEDKITGNIGPVKKDAVPLPASVVTPIENRSNILFAATTVTSGEARAVAFATGKSTYVVARHGGLIVRAGEGIPLINDLKSWCTKGSLISLAAAIVIAFISLLLSDGTYHAATIFLAAISFAVASFSESFSAVACMILASSMNEAAPEAVIKDGAMVEKIAATDCIILSSSSVLRCGEISVSGYDYAFRTVSGKVSPCKELDDLLEIAYLSTGASIGSVQSGYADDTRTKLRSLCERCFSKAYRAHPASIIGYMPRGEAQSADLNNTLISGEKHNILLISGGAARVLSFCSSYLENDSVKPLTEKKCAEIISKAEAFEKDLSSVVAFATVETDNVNFTRIGAARTKMTYVGFIATSNPVTSGVPELIKDTRAAGFSYVMFTDGASYDIKIAEKCGILTNRDRCISAKESAELRMFELEPGECAVIELPSDRRAEVKASVTEQIKNSGRISSYIAVGTEDSEAFMTSDVAMAALKHESLSSTPLVLLTGSDVILHPQKGSGGLFDAMRAVAYAKNVFVNIRRVVSYMLSSQCSVAVMMVSAALFGTPLPNSVFLLFYGMIIGFLAMLSMALRLPENGTLTKGRQEINGFMSVKNMVIPCGTGIICGIVTVAAVAISGTVTKGATVFSGATTMFVSTLLSSLICAFESGAFPGKCNASFRSVVSFVSFVAVTSVSVILVRFFAPCAALIGGELMSVGELIASFVPPVVLLALSEVGRRI